LLNNGVGQIAKRRIPVNMGCTENLLASDSLQFSKSAVFCNVKLCTITYGILYIITYIYFMTKRHMKIALYLRVSTSEQTTDSQRRELKKWAKAAGHEVVAVFEDAGISGTNGRDQRPQFDLMLKAAVRREFDLLAAWSVDRLGRSLQDLVATLSELQAANVGLFLHQQAIDTTTPAGKAMFQMLGVFAEFEHTIIQERVKVGIRRAQEQGTKSGRPIGRPQIKAKMEAKIREILAQGHGIRKTAKLAGAGVGTVHRIKRSLKAEVT